MKNWLPNLPDEDTTLVYRIVFLNAHISLRFNPFLPSTQGQLEELQKKVSSVLDTPSPPTHQQLCDVHNYLLKLDGETRDQEAMEEYNGRSAFIDQLSVEWEKREEFKVQKKLGTILESFRCEVDKHKSWVEKYKPKFETMKRGILEKVEHKVDESFPSARPTKGQEQGDLIAQMKESLEKIYGSLYAAVFALCHETFQECSKAIKGAKYDIMRLRTLYAFWRILFYAVDFIVFAYIIGTVLKGWILSILLPESASALARVIDVRVLLVGLLIWLLIKCIVSPRVDRWFEGKFWYLFDTLVDKYRLFALSAYYQRSNIEYQFKTIRDEPIP